MPAGLRPSAPGGAPEATADRWRRIGVALALTSAVLGVAAGLVSLAWPAPSYASLHSWSRAFERAALWCALAALPGLAAGMHLCCLPEFRRAGRVAGRFLRAERMQLGGGRPRAVWLVWIAVFASSLVLMSLWLRQGAAIGSFGARGNPWAPAMLLSALGLGVTAVAATGFLAGHGLSIAIRHGGAGEMLLARHSPEHLGWAAAAAHRTRGLWMSAAALPTVVGSCLILVNAWSRMAGVAWAPALFVLWFAGVVLIQYWAVRFAAAAGVCCGASVRFPVVSGLLAGAAALAACGVIVAVFTGVAMAIERTWKGGPQFLDFCLLIVGPALTVWLLGELCSAAALWLTRRALAQPVSLRAGAWLTGAGEALLGLCGESAARDRACLPAHLLDWPHRRRAAWRLPLVGIASATALAVAVFVMGGEPPLGWSDTGRFVCLGVGFLTLLAAAGGVVGGWTAVHRSLEVCPGLEPVRAPAAAGRPEARLSGVQKAGLAVAAAGLPVSLAAALAATAVAQSPAGEFGQVWHDAFRVFAVLFLAHLTVGVFLYCRPFLAPAGPLAAKLAAAEAGDRRGRRTWLWSRLGVPVSLTGLALLGHMAWMLPWSDTELLTFCGVLVAAAAVCSLAVHALAAGRAARHTARSRRDGPAADLLRSGPGAELFPWAAFRSGSREDLWRLAAVGSVFAGLIAAGTARAFQDLSWGGHALAGGTLLAGLVFSEYLGQKAASALGVWAGCALPAPGAACVLAVGTSLAVWAARLAVLVPAVALGSELAAAPWLKLLLGCAIFCAAWLGLTTAATVLALKAVRASLDAPLLARAGAWAVRRGEGLMGMAAGECRAGAPFAHDRGPVAEGGRVSLAFRAWLAILGAAYGSALAWFLAGGLGEELRRAWGGDQRILAGLVLVALLGCVGAFVLTVVRLLRPKPGAAGAAEKEGSGP